MNPRKPKIKPQADSYYPFGLTMNGLSYQALSDDEKNLYLYNGKAKSRFFFGKLQEDFDLDWYDYGARFYDPVIGRFTTVDPLAEKFYSISPYVYVANNPLKFIDPTGMFLTDYYNLKGKLVYHANDGSNEKRIVFTNSKNQSDVNIAITNGETMTVPSENVMTAANNAISDQDNTGFEHGFAVANDNTASIIVNNGSTGSVDLAPAFTDLRNKGKTADYDVHTHPSDYTMPDASGSYTASAPEPSGNPAGSPGGATRDYAGRELRESIGSTNPSWVIGMETSFSQINSTNPSTGKITSTWNPSQTRKVTFYNSTKNLHTMTWKSFENLVNKVR